MPQTVRAVLFDAVGTLIYPDPPVAVAYWSAGQEFGSSLPIDEVALRFHSAFSEFTQLQPSGANDFDNDCFVTSKQRERQRWKNIVAEVFHDVPSANGELFERLWVHFSRAENWAVFDDVAGALRAQADRELVLGIASNFDERLVGICQKLHPLPSFSHLFYSAGIGYSKPHPQFFQRVEQHLGFSREEILFVGDSELNDVLGAQAVGWQAVLLDRQGKSTNANSISRLTDLPSVLAARC